MLWTRGQIGLQEVLRAKIRDLLDPPPLPGLQVKVSNLMVDRGVVKKKKKMKEKM